MSHSWRDKHCLKIDFLKIKKRGGWTNVFLFLFFLLILNTLSSEVKVHVRLNHADLWDWWFVQIHFNSEQHVQAHMYTKRTWLQSKYQELWELLPPVSCHLRLLKTHAWPNESRPLELIKFIALSWYVHVSSTFGCSYAVRSRMLLNRRFINFIIYLFYPFTHTAAMHREKRDGLCMYVPIW